MTTEPEILDDGRVLTRCSDCQVEVYLDPDGEPMPEGTLGRYMMKLAALVRCEDCDSKAEAAARRFAVKAERRAGSDPRGCPRRCSVCGGPK